MHLILKANVLRLNTAGAALTQGCSDLSCYGVWRLLVSACMLLQLCTCINTSVLLVVDYSPITTHGLGNMLYSTYCVVEEHITVFCTKRVAAVHSCVSGSHVRGYWVDSYSHNVPRSQHPFHNGHVCLLFTSRTTMTS